MEDPIEHIVAHILRTQELAGYGVYDTSGRFEDGHEVIILSTPDPTKFVLLNISIQNRGDQS